MSKLLDATKLIKFLSNVLKIDNVENRDIKITKLVGAYLIAFVDHSRYFDLTLSTKEQFVRIEVFEHPRNYTFNHENDIMTRNLITVVYHDELDNGQLHLLNEQIKLFLIEYRNKNSKQKQIDQIFGMYNE